jgi:hypothetical protein
MPPHSGKGGEMRNTWRLGICGLAVLWCTAPAMAWWDAGHKIIAAIAFRQLTPDEQQSVFALLHQHPRWSADFGDWMPDQLADAPAAERAEWAFMQAAIWPDLARDFDDADKTRYHHATWHYVNTPLYLSDADRRALAGRLTVNFATDPPPMLTETMNITQTLAVTRQTLIDPTVPAATKGELLTWIFHLVGDSHQPMHSTALFTPNLFPEGCRGGNSIRTKPRENLHAVWDGLLGERLGYRQARNEALKLLSDDTLKAAGEQARRSLDPRDWIQESRTLSAEFAYGPEVLTPLRIAEQSGEKPPMIALSEEYLSIAGQVAKRRAVEAGYRLGAVLKAIVRQP